MGERMPVSAKPAIPGNEGAGKAPAWERLVPSVTRRQLLVGASSVALLAACAPASAQRGSSGEQEPWSDGTFWSDGTGWVA